MKVLKKIYVSPKIKKSSEVLASLVNKELLDNHYIIFVLENGNNLMEVMECIYMEKKFNSNDLAIGLAENEKDANKLLVTIMQEFIEKNRTLKCFKSFYFGEEYENI